MLIAFSLAVLALVFVVLALLLSPLLRPVPGARENTANLDILREQLAELATEQAAGRLTEAAANEAQDEIKRRILEERAMPKARALPFVASVKTAVVLTLALVVGSVALYGVLGQPLALLPEIQNARRANAPENTMSPEEMRAAAARLAARLQENPEDSEGWIMLARTYKLLDQPADAAAAYAHVEEKISDNPDLLADYAEALAISSTTRMQGKPTILVGQALELNPRHAHALFLAGMAALEAGRKEEAARHWEKLLPMVEPGSELHQLLSDNIASLRAPAGNAAN
jgi:cytochrome c-type biogenesis protein CcmH